jgi:hypothetical protein
VSKAKKFFVESAKQAAAAKKAEEKRLAAEKKRQEEEEQQARRDYLLENPYTTLDTLLIMALMEKFHGQVGMSGKPQKWLNKLWEIKDYVAPAVVPTVVQPLLKAPLPFKELDAMVDNYLTLGSATEEFVAQKYHGMLIYEKEIYPIKLLVEKDVGYKWVTANEVQIMRMAAHVACEMFDLETIQCHVMFFAAFNMSGRMGSVAHRRIDIKEAFPDQDEANVVNLVKVVA